MEEAFIQNEFDDKITKAELRGILERTRKLTPQAIDELWFRVGFAFEDRGSNKALPAKAIEDMVKSDEAAENLLEMLFMESHLEDLRKTLADIERERGSRL